MHFKKQAKEQYLVFGRRHGAFGYPIHGVRQIVARSVGDVFEGGGDGGAQRGVQAAAELLLFGGSPVGHVVHAQPKRLVLAVERVYVPTVSGGSGKLKLREREKARSVRRKADIETKTKLTKQFQTKHVLYTLTIFSITIRWRGIEWRVRGVPCRWRRLCRAASSRP